MYGVSGCGGSAARYHSLVIRRLYVHNFRCLENFDLTLREPSVLLIGKNGSGKTTVGLALEILQRIARGTNRVGDLVRPDDLTGGRMEVPMRFEIEVEIQRRTYMYSIAFESMVEIGALRVAEEWLKVDGTPVFSRDAAQVNPATTGQVRDARFHSQVVALPIIQEQGIRCAGPWREELRTSRHFEAHWRSTGSGSRPTKQWCS